MTSNTMLVIIRHGETEWNRLNRYQGHADSPLTTRGLSQARAVAEALSGESFDAFYSSDLGRAVKTASVIAERIGRRFITDRRLREQHYGLMQGQTVKRAREIDPGYFKSLENGNPEYAPRGGESRKDRHERCLGVLNEIADKHSGEKILVVTHGGIVDSLFRETLGIPLESPRHYSLFNAALNQFSRTGGPGEAWSLVLWGDVSHLSAAGTTDAGRSITAA